MKMAQRRWHNEDGTLRLAQRRWHVKAQHTCKLLRSKHDRGMPKAGSNPLASKNDDD